MSTAKKHKDWCQLTHCEEPADKDRASGLCGEHTREWVLSPEWRDATNDTAVRLYIGIRDEKKARNRMNVFKRRWLKRVTAEPEQEDAS